MRLEPYRDEDRWLTRALETDPAVMAELGGAREESEIPAIHRRRLASPDAGGDWLTIRPDDDDTLAGAIGVWPREWRDQTVHETGWMLLPAFQGRGIAREALTVLIARVRAAGRVAALHAWPGTANAASNALCRGAGFAVVEEDVEVAYGGRPLRVRHWRLEL